MTNDFSRQSPEYQLAQQLLTEARGEPNVAARARLISARLLGQPYRANPLGGSPQAPERLVVRLDGFDCVTYVETVLALSLVREAEAFPARLRDIRYENGRVEWVRRLHYIHDWAAYQQQCGVLRDMTQGEGAVVKEKTLSLVPGLPTKTVPIRYYPKSQFPAVSRWLTDGDLLYFLSTRRGLDVFHIGMVFRAGDELRLRHARQMRRRVYEQPLSQFMRAVQVPGFIVNRLVV
jgi:Protein of unknown function (DUF1460)